MAFIKKQIQQLNLFSEIDCSILKLDIKGYFMAMNKSSLFDKARNEIIRNKNKVDF